MKSLLEELRPTIRDLAVFSFCVNLLFVVPALYTLQVFDRVLPSNSYETLLVLSLGTAIALIILLLLDNVRGRLQHAMSGRLDEQLSAPGGNSRGAESRARPGRSQGRRRARHRRTALKCKSRRA